ncbi:uncharacterized protein [Amphiura filiformis]|uniref:uncharacterized protein n=1 Tax=Amphiura filiformis TaxID=82378 RepID=UPI003B224EA1
MTYISTKHAATGCSPVKLFIGREIRTRLSLVRPNLQEGVISKQAMQKDHYDMHSKYREFFPGETVLVKDSRKEQTWWPGTIAERSAHKSYIVTLTDGRVWKRHVDHLRRGEVMPSRQATQSNLLPATESDLPLTPFQRSAPSEWTPRETSPNLPSLSENTSDKTPVDV